ncbi:hypothetical protein HMPREF0971_02308 [Segatella oris F0302]|uniref:Uncharacterized protein n=1 Tax=Segatella oris F0302 TaxID=649760 RepID=D1QTH9_9BACT|nr:hypothetical protein HMPREF0971_02308 [Segatella oris F0302]
MSYRSKFNDMQNGVAFQQHATYEEERIALQFRQSFFEHQRLPFMNVQSRRIH